MSEPRRYLVAAGTRHYRELGELRGAHRDVGRIVDLFGAMGYERVLTEVSRDPDADEFENALADWCAGGGLTAGDVVVVYYAGHGDPPIAGPYRPACAGSVATRPRTWLSLENLAAILAESPVRDVLFIVDACHAGLGADELGAVTAAFAATRGRGAEPGSGTWVLASARRRELASDEGHFVTELARAHTAGDGASQRRLSPALLADRINRAFVTAGHAQRAVCSVTDQSIQPPFFPNPAFDPAAEIGPDGRAEGEASDLTAHFEPRGRGVEHVHDPGSYFTGRAHALDVVRTRLAGPGGRGPLAVTGAPGSGKSALLGRIVLEGDTSGGAPPIDVSINARHQTIDALIGRLAGAADVRASSVDALLAAPAGRRAPYRVVVDSLDEAGPGHDIVEARRIAWELLRPLGDVPCLRLVVGSRRELLSDWCKHAPIVDLDTDAYADDTSVADVRSPYTDAPDTARVIAQAVARRAGRCFLVARMTASALLRQEPVDVRTSGWADATPLRRRRRVPLLPGAPTRDPPRHRVDPAHDPGLRRGPRPAPRGRMDGGGVQAVGRGGMRARHRRIGGRGGFLSHDGRRGRASVLPPLSPGVDGPPARKGAGCPEHGGHPGVLRRRAVEPGASLAGRHGPELGQYGALCPLPPGNARGSGGHHR
ncbi:caspase family protein [Embleya sp. NPDC055664]